MAPNPRRLDARLDELYATLPKIDCKGLCSESCGPIAMSRRERTRIEELDGPVTLEGIDCSKLKEKRCTVYELRPMICRLWGLVPEMKCPYGCVPEGGFMDSEEGARSLARSLEIGGDPGPEKLEGELRSLARTLTIRQITNGPT